jgi:SAP domain-containing ribonucleoprotein
MTDYAKLKNAELEALLKQRGLPHAGKKADMVARLQEDDSKKTTTEDVIDWDDDEPAKADAPAAAAPTIPTTVALDTPAVTAANTVEATITTDASASQDIAPNATSTEDAPAEKAKTPVDFSIGLAEATIDEEIEKRKARAKKFGMTENDPLADEALMKLERAKKFGDAAGPRGLNEALPERQKRRHEGGADGGRDLKRRGGGGGRGGSRFNGNGNRRRDGGPAPSGSQPSRVEKTAGSGGSGWMSATDKAAAEARKARFAAPASK